MIHDVLMHACDGRETLHYARVADSHTLLLWGAYRLNSLSAYINVLLLLGNQQNPPGV